MQLELVVVVGIMASISKILLDRTCFVTQQTGFRYCLFHQKETDILGDSDVTWCHHP